MYKSVTGMKKGRLNLRNSNNNRLQHLVTAALVVLSAGIFVGCNEAAVGTNRPVTSVSGNDTSDSDTNGNAPAPTTDTDNQQPPRPPAGTNSTGASTPPNFIVILTDDEDYLAHTFRPKFHQLMVSEGVFFENAFVSRSICCPSRVTILRGQYPHNHGVLHNGGTFGGFNRYLEQGLEQSHVATWLQDVGYRTGFYGKFLNGYRGPDQTYVPPGWDDWNAFVTPNNFFDFNINSNGNIVFYGNKATEYSARVLTRLAIDFIKASVADGKPFFTLISTVSPHGPATPPPEYANQLSWVAVPRIDSFNEANVNDKPDATNAGPPLSAQEITDADDFYADRIRSLYAVDDGIESIINDLEALGINQDTYIFYLSDNGLRTGHHRIRGRGGKIEGKGSSYDIDIRIPFVVRGPGIPRGRTSKQLVLTNDLAPTIASLAGAVPDYVPDGRNLNPLFLSAGTGNIVPWRKSILSDRWVKYTDGSGTVTGATPYPAIRTEFGKYVIHDTGEREAYYYPTDPHETRNIGWKFQSDKRDEIESAMFSILNCIGFTCLGAEDYPVEITHVAE